MMPALTRVFDEQRAEQQQLIRVALIQKDVNETRRNALEWFDKLVNRGEQLEQVAKQSEELEESSRVFLIATKKQRCCCSCIPSWWYEKNTKRAHIVTRRGV